MNLSAEEQKMLKACQSGEPLYQKMLYERFYGKMLAVCLRYARDREEGKDILQEGYIKVFTSIINFKGEGSLEGWIRRIMVNTAINYYHKNKKLTQQASIDDENNLIHYHLNNIEEADIFQKLNYEDLLTLVRALPPAYQAVFNLYAIEGYTHKEIGELLHINEGTSKSNLAKARMKLQKKLHLLLEQNNTIRCVE